MPGPRLGRFLPGFRRARAAGALRKAVILHRGEFTPDYEYMASSSADRKGEMIMKKVLILGAGLVARPLVRLPP